MRDVGFLAFQPWWFGDLIGVGAAGDDLGYGFSKFAFDIPQAFRTAAVLDRVMQQGCNCFCFARAVFQRDRSDSENVRDIGNPGFLAKLTAVNPRCVKQRLLKLLRESHVSPFAC